MNNEKLNITLMILVVVVIQSLIVVLLAHLNKSRVNAVNKNVMNKCFS